MDFVATRIDPRRPDVATISPISGSSLSSSWREESRFHGEEEGKVEGRGRVCDRWLLPSLLRRSVGEEG